MSCIKMLYTFLVISDVLFFILSVNGQGFDRCNCFMLGTLEDDEGQSVCNKETRICSCLTNVIGTNCDSCKDGYFGLLSGQGCRPCSCNLVGAERQRCHPHTGKCPCKLGFTGLKCEFCNESTPIINEACCSCDETSSLNPNCDRQGKCACKDNATGEKCEKCVNNYHKIFGIGCVKCHQCYTSITDRLDEFLKKIEAIKILLAKAEVASEDVEDFKTFEKALHDLKEKIEKLDDSKLQSAQVESTVLKVLDDLSKKFDALLSSSDKLTGNNVVKQVQQKHDTLNNTLLPKAARAYEKFSQFKLTNEDVTKIHLEADIITNKIVQVAEDLSKFNKTKNDIDADNATVIRKLEIFQIQYEKYHSDVINLINHFTSDPDVYIKVCELTDQTAAQKDQAKTLKEAAKNLLLLLLRDVPELNNIKIYEDFLVEMEKKLAGFGFDYQNDVDVEKLQKKLDKIEEFVVYAKDKKKESVEMINGVKEYASLKDILKNLNETNEQMTELEVELLHLNKQIDETKINITEKLLPDIKQLQESLELFRKEKNSLNTNLDVLLTSDLESEYKEHIAVTEQHLKTLKIQHSDLNSLMNSLLKITSNFEDEMKQLNNLQKMLLEAKACEDALRHHIQLNQEVTSFLKASPAHESNVKLLDDVEKEMDALEEHLREYDELLVMKRELEEEVARLAMVSESLPNEENWCKNQQLTLT